MPRDMGVRAVDRRTQGPDNNDLLTSPWMHTISFADATTDHATGVDGQFERQRVASTVAPVVVRQHALPDGAAQYQEARGYSFLLNSPKYPGMTMLDDGTILLTLTVALTGETVATEDGVTLVDEATRDDVLLRSTDGVNWEQPILIPGYRTTPMNLGGSRLMLRGWSSKVDVPETFCFWFSEDAGRSFNCEPEPVPPLPDGRRVITDVSPSMLVEGDTIYFMFMVADPEGEARGGSGTPAGWDATTVLWKYNHVLHTWSNQPYFFPLEWRRAGRTSEASIIRAANGNLLASFRSGRPGPSSLPADKWRGLVTATSSDNGATWSMPKVHSLYAHVHSSLLLLPDGRLMMTYAARVGEIDGVLYHGHEAVISDDHGESFDWAQRYRLPHTTAPYISNCCLIDFALTLYCRFVVFRGVDGAQHSPQSVCLRDGRILTVVMHPVAYTWRGEPGGALEARGNLQGISNVSCVVWDAGVRIAAL